MTEEQHVETAEATEVPEIEHAESGTQETPKPSWNAEAEEEARAFGWKSPDEWKGDIPPTYIDNPEAYLERLQKAKPFRVMQERLAEQQEALRKIEAMNERALQMQRQQYEARLHEVEAAKLQAVQAGDVDRYKALEGQERQLQGAMTQGGQDDPSEYVNTYAKSDEGKWVEDPALRALGAQIIEANPGIKSRPAAEQIAYAKQALERLHPHLFQSPQSEPKPAPRTSPVEGGSLAAGRIGSDPFSKLPADAKAAFKRFASEGLFKDTPEGRKAYAEEYNNA